MNVNAIKTAEVCAAVNKIKNLTKNNFDYGVSFEIPKEFIEKRHYMQSDEFLSNGCNKQVLDLIDDIMQCRDEIKNKINEMNIRLKGIFIQGTNGLTRFKSELEKNPVLNFEDKPAFNTSAENQYLSKKLALHTISSRK